jgi:large subunit ribosomal protein L23
VIAHHVIKRPLVTEKSNIGREEQNVVTFAVAPAANKLEIRRAVEELPRRRTSWRSVAR